MRSFARTWTTDLKARRIRVNAISPRPIADTEAVAASCTRSGADRLRSLSTVVPLGRMGTGDEIAKAAVFLASDDSSFVTGIELSGTRFAQCRGRAIYRESGNSSTWNCLAAEEITSFRFDRKA